MTKEEFIVQYCMHCSWTGKKYYATPEIFAKDIIDNACALADELQKLGLIK